MDELLMRMRSAMSAETLLRIEQYGEKYSSDVEAWGLALEELCEGFREYKEVKECLMEYFALCMLKKADRADSAVLDVLERGQAAALRMAAELVQFAVVFEKAKNRESFTF